MKFMTNIQTDSHNRTYVLWGPSNLITKWNERRQTVNCPSTHAMRLWSANSRRLNEKLDSY